MLRRAHPVSVVSLAALLAAGCAPITTGSAMFGDPRGGGDFSIPIRSMEDLRFDTVVRQRYDFSCGSAALATLLHYHYGVPTDEEAAFRGMWREGDRDQIRRLGFSLLDMKRYLAAQGYQADGYQVTLDEIERSGVPGIVLLNLGGYRHFVVVKGVQGDEVLVGDPALGMRTLSRAEFTETWAGVYFVLNSELDRGRATFGAPAQWAAYRRGPADGFFNEPMSQQALALSAPFLTDF